MRKAAVPGGQLGDLPLSDPVSRCPKVSDAHESNNVTRIPHQFLEDPERWIRYHSAELVRDAHRVPIRQPPGGRRIENQPTGHGPKGWLGSLSKDFSIVAFIVSLG